MQVTGWDRNEVQVNADLSDGVAAAGLQDQRRAHDHRSRAAEGRSYQGSTDLVVHVPRNSSLSINTVSADQTIKDVRGMQRLQAVSGMIQTELCNEDLEIKNVSGEISVRGHSGKGALRVTTVSGDLRLTTSAPKWS